MRPPLPDSPGSSRSALPLAGTGATRRGGGGSVVALVAVLALLAGIFLASGGVWERVGSQDLHGIFVPRYEHAARVWRDLRVPLWNREEFCGLPLLGTGQAAGLYAPAILPFAVLAPRSALQAVYVMHILLFGAATILYLRACGTGTTPAAIAALVGLAGLFSGLVGFGIDHPNFIAGLAWVPVMLLAWQWGASGRAGPGIAALGLAGGAQWLSGYPDFAMDTAVLVGIVALLSDAAPLGRRIAVLAAGLALGVALAAVQLLPLADAVAESGRGKGSGWATALQLQSALFSVSSLSDLARNGLRPQLTPAIVLAVLALGRPSRLRVAWAAAFVVSLFAVTPPLSLVYRLPPFSLVRFPVGWGHIGPFFLGLLAAAGAGDAARIARPWPRRAVHLLGLLAAAAASYVVWRAPATLPWPAVDYARAAEQARVLRGLVETRGGPSAGSRVMSAELAASGGALRHGLRAPTGYEPAVPPRRVDNLLRLVGLRTGAPRWRELAKRPDVAALLGLGIVVVPAGPAGWLEHAGFTRITELPAGDVVVEQTPVPRARLVHRAVLVEDESASLAWIVENASQLRATAVIEAKTLASPLREPPAGTEERVAIVDDEAGRLVVEVTAASAALLVVTDTFLPGWRASVDGQETPVLIADHAFRAVPVEPGTHRVEFWYAPTALRLGTGLSVVALLSCAALLLWRRRDQ